MKDKIEKMIHGAANTLDTIKKPIFVSTMGLIHLSYFLVYFGIFAISREYINILNIFIQSFICLFLIIRFNPFRRHVLREFDDQLIFASAMFLLTNLIATEIGFTYFDYFVNKINPFYPKQQ
jgi:hypothetical protein